MRHSLIFIRRSGIGPYQTPFEAFTMKRAQTNPRPFSKPVSVPPGRIPSVGRSKPYVQKISGDVCLFKNGLWLRNEWRADAFEEELSDESPPWVAMPWTQSGVGSFHEVDKEHLESILSRCVAKLCSAPKPSVPEDVYWTCKNTVKIIMLGMKDSLGGSRRYSVVLQTWSEKLVNCPSEPLGKKLLHNHRYLGMYLYFHPASGTFPGRLELTAAPRKHVGSEMASGSLVKQLNSALIKRQFGAKVVSREKSKSGCENYMEGQQSSGYARDRNGCIKLNAFRHLRPKDAGKTTLKPHLASECSTEVYYLNQPLGKMKDDYHTTLIGLYSKRSSNRLSDTVSKIVFILNQHVAREAQGPISTSSRTGRS